MSAPELEIRISADIAELKTALNAIQGDLGKLTTRAQDAGAKAAAGMEKFRNATSRAITMVKALFAALAGAVVIRSIINAADQMTNLASRLSLVTRSTEELAAAQEGVFEIAQRTRSGLAETADLYFRIANSGKELGLSQERVLRLTESINKAVQISGVSAEAANAGLIQFSQGLASGALRGDELRSVLEQIPGLADAIAAGMGVSRTKLRELGEQGKLTAEAILGALEKQGAILDEKFAKFPITVGGAMTKVRNSVLKLIGDLSKSTGVVSDLANSISKFADYLSSPEFLGAAIEWTTILVEGFKSIGDAFSETGDFIRDTWPGLLADGDTFVKAFIRILGQIPINIKTAVQLLVVEVAATFDKLLVNARLVWNTIKAIFSDATVEGAVAVARAEIAAIESARDQTIAAILAERERVIQAGEDARRAAEKARDVKASTDAPDKPKGTNVGLVVDDLKLLKDATDRAIQDVERLYEDAKISADEYLQRRAALQLGLIEAEIAAERKRVAEGGKGANDALTNIVILERQKTAVMEDAERERTSIAKEYADKRLELTIRNLEASGQKAEAKRLELEAEWSETLARMAAEGDTAGVALIEGLIKREVLDAKLEEITGAFDEAVERLQTTEQSIANQVQAGVITQTQAERELQTVRGKSVTQLRAYIKALEDLYAATGDDRVLAVIDEYKNKLADAERVTDTFGAKVRDSFENSLKGFFEDIITATSSVEDAFKNMARAFAAAVADMIAQALAAQVVRTLLASFGGGAGAAVAHTGGVINSRVTNRKVNPAVFLNAPRYHEGGVAGGLKPGEVPAILQQGEEVLTRDDPRHQANGGTSGGEAGGAGIRIVNVLDPSLISDAIGGAAGERAIMNVIQRNAGGISRLLAR